MKNFNPFCGGSDDDDGDDFVVVGKKGKKLSKGNGMKKKKPITSKRKSKGEIFRKNYVLKDKGAGAPCPFENNSNSVCFFNSVLNIISKLTKLRDLFLSKGGNCWMKDMLQQIENRFALKNL